MPQRSKLVRKLDRETQGLHGRLELIVVESEEVDVGWKGAKKVQDVVTAVVANDSLALDWRTQLKLFPAGVEHLVRQDLQLGGCFAQLE